MASGAQQELQEDLNGISIAGERDSMLEESAVLGPEVRAAIGGCC